MTADEYATALALASSQIVAAVHRGDHSGPYIKAALTLNAPPHTDRVTGLINLLAAQVNPDTTLSERLRWTEPEVQAACRGAA
jgi:pyocin large subunit-like protein